jgi:hypothetical protein
MMHQLPLPSTFFFFDFYFFFTSNSRPLYAKVKHALKEG